MIYNSPIPTSYLKGSSMEKHVDSDRLNQQIAFITTIDALKDVIRRTFIVSGSRLENTAEHSWHAAMSAVILQEYAEEPVDVFRVVQMLLVHDIVEVLAGDTFIYDTENGATQEAREINAADQLFGMLPEDQNEHFRALWDDFESLGTPESRFAKSIDRLMPLLLNYANGGISWTENNINDRMVASVNERIKPGSGYLWKFADFLREQSVEKGYLQPISIDDQS